MRCATRKRAREKVASKMTLEMRVWGTNGEGRVERTRARYVCSAHNGSFEREYAGIIIESLARLCVGALQYVFWPG